MSPKLFNTLLILIPVIMYYAVFNPLYSGVPGLVWTPDSSISALQSTKVQYINTYNLISKVDKDMKRINDNYTSIPETTVATVTQMLPDEIDPIRLRNEVISIANNAGVAITGVRVVEVNTNSTPGIGAYLINFSVKARYKDVKKLLQSYEKSTRFYNLESLSITRFDPKGVPAQDVLLADKEALQVNVGYKVFYLLK